jgi:hypothetical protein
VQARPGAVASSKLRIRPAIFWKPWLAQKLRLAKSISNTLASAASSASLSRLALVRAARRISTMSVTSVA